MLTAKHPWFLGACLLGALLPTAACELGGLGTAAAPDAAGGVGTAGDSGSAGGTGSGSGGGPGNPGGSGAA